MIKRQSALADLLTECQRRDIRFTLQDGDRLGVAGPGLTPELLARIQANEAELLDLVKRAERRAAAIVQERGRNREGATLLARLEVLRDLEAAPDPRAVVRDLSVILRVPCE